MQIPSWLPCARLVQFLDDPRDDLHNDLHNDPHNAAMDMNATDHILFAAWAVVWLISPVTGWAIAKMWPRFSPLTRQATLAVCGVSLVLAACTAFAPWALRGFWANAGNLGFAFICLSGLIWLAFRKCRKWLAVATPLAIHLALAVPIFAGLVLSNNQIPFRQIYLGHNLVARIYRHGFVGADFDQAVLVQQPRGLPLMEHRFYTRKVEYPECTETSARLVETSAGDTVQIMCATRTLETVPVP